MRAIRRSLKLIDDDLRENEEANRLFLEILTSKNDAETVLRRMNEAGVLGKFVRTFGRIVAMMQFNMYHHYTVDEHLLRCIGILSDIEAGRAEDAPFATELMRTIQPEHRTLLYVALFLHDIAKGRIEDHSIAGARVARRLCPRFGLSPAETETVAWLVEQHLVMSTVAQSRDLSDRVTIQNFAEVVQSVERHEASDHPHRRRHQGRRSGRLERLEGAAHPHALLRDRAGADRRLLRGQPRPARRDGAGGAARRAQGLAGRARSTPISPATIRPTGSRSTCRPRSRMRISCARPKPPASRSPPRSTSTSARGVTELTVFAPDHPRLLSIIAGACAMAGANIVDAQIFTTTDARALDTIAISRGFERDEDEERRAARVAADDRAGAARRSAAAGDGRQARAAQGPPEGVRGRARRDHQQPVVQPLHHGRGDRARSSRPALRTDRDAVEAQPQHRLGARRDLRRARGRRVLCDRPARRRRSRRRPGRRRSSARCCSCSCQPTHRRSRRPPQASGRGRLARHRSQKRQRLRAVSPAAVVFEHLVV